MDALRYVQDLVAHDSTSILSNVAVSDYVENALRELGFDTERIEYDDARGVRKVNVAAKRGEGRGGMAYFGHTDVVPADPWFSDEHGPFTPVVKGDRLYGRGSCDMKGSIACMLAAARRIGAKDLKQPIYVTCTADEEIGFRGAEQIVSCASLYREMVEGQSRGIVGEPTMLEVVHAHKGIYGFSATSRGRAAHSSTSDGENANLAMIPFLSEMKRIHDETLSDAAWRDDAFDPPTLSWNIGINDHNPAFNITAAKSRCTVYFRPMPGQDAEILVRRARRAAEECGIDFETGWIAGPFYTDPHSEFVQEVLGLAGKDVSRTVSYGTDGARFDALKNLIVLGPGDIAQAHTFDEWIGLDQLKRGTDLYEKLIRHWCC